MMSVFHNSRIIRTRISSICRYAGTTIASSSETGVRGAASNLSQASRSADGTDMAMRDAKQRGTSTQSSNPKSAGEQSNPSKVGTLLNSIGKIGSAIILTASAYFIYTNYIENHEFSNNLHLNKRDSREQSTSRDGST